jgi:cell shape-determining protein MreC
VLVLAALTLVTIDARSTGTGLTTDIRSKVHDAFSPLQRGTHAALQPIGNFFTGAVDYGALKQENLRLRDQIAAVQRQQVQAAAEQAAAEQVLAEQNLPFVSGIPQVTVEIIDNGSANFENSVTVNKGTSSGLALRVSVDTTAQAPPAMSKDQPVVTSGLLSEKFPPNIPVGRVVNAATTPGASEPDITLAPLVDLSRLTYLQVLLWSPQ